MKPRWQRARVIWGENRQAIQECMGRLIWVRAVRPRTIPVEDVSSGLHAERAVYDSYVIHPATGEDIVVSAELLELLGRDEDFADDVTRVTPEQWYAETNDEMSRWREHHFGSAQEAA